MIPNAESIPPERQLTQTIHLVLRNNVLRRKLIPLAKKHISHESILADEPGKMKLPSPQTRRYRYKE